MDEKKDLVLPLIVSDRSTVRDVHEPCTYDGAFVVFACALGLVGRDYIEMEGILRRCVALEIGCRFYPGDFTRYAIYAGIAMVQTFVLFMTGLKIEERRRRR